MTNNRSLTLLCTMNVCNYIIVQSLIDWIEIPCGIRHSLSLDSFCAQSLSFWEWQCGKRHRGTKNQAIESIIQAGLWFKLECLRLNRNPSWRQTFIILWLIMFRNVEKEQGKGKYIIGKRIKQQNRWYKQVFDINIQCTRQNHWHVQCSKLMWWLT